MQTLWSLNICHETRRFIRTRDELVPRTHRTTSLLQSARQQTPPLLHRSFHPSSAHGRSTFKQLKKKKTQQQQPFPRGNTMQLALPCSCLSSRLKSGVKTIRRYCNTRAKNKKTLSRSIDRRGATGGKSQTPTVPGQLGGGRVDRVLDLNPHFPGLPGVAEVPHLQRRHAALGQRQCPAS